jgi:hypothetical protein
MAEKADDKKSDKKEDKKVDSKPRVVSIQEKKSKQKEVISKLSVAESQKGTVYTNEPITPTSSGTKIKLSLSFEIDSHAKGKIPFLLLMLLFATLSFVMLARTGFTFSDVFDFHRISNNLDKLFSIAFILFLLLFALALAFGTYFGFGLRSGSAMLFSLFLLIPLVIAYFVNAHFLLAYVWLAFAIMIGMLFGTLTETLTLGSIWKTMGNTLMVMLIVAALFTLVKVNSQKDDYFDLFVTSVAKLTPQLQGQIQGSLGNQIEKIDLSSDNLTTENSNPIKYVTKSSVRALVKLQYPSFRDVNINSFKKPDDKEYAKTNIPAGFDSLDSDSQAKLIDDTFTYLKSPETSDITSGSIKQIWPELRKALADRVKTAPVREVTPEEIIEIRKNLNELKFFRQFYDFFEVFIALLVVSVLSFGNFILRAISSLFCYGITRII